MGRLAQQTPGLEAARDGRVIMRHLAAQTVTGSFVVETGVGTYYDIPEGKQVIITSMHVGCEDADEFAAAYIVACDAVAGGGTPTQKHSELHEHVGTKKEGRSHIVDAISPPLCIKYSGGYRSISMALKATDTNTVVQFGWMGWYEDEGTLS